MKYLYGCAHEQFPPDECLRQAVAAEQATLGDPEMAPDVIEAYRAARSDAGREQGEIVIQAQFSWAGSDQEALDGARVWKGAQPDEFYKEDFHEPAEMYERGQAQMSDDELRDALIISAAADVHVERIGEVATLGATQIALMNCSGVDPQGAIGFYRDSILPILNRPTTKGDQ